MTDKRLSHCLNSVWPVSLVEYICSMCLIKLNSNFYSSEKKLLFVNGWRYNYVINLFWWFTFLMIETKIFIILKKSFVFALSEKTHLNLCNVKIIRVPLNSINYETMFLNVLNACMYITLKHQHKSFDNFL